LTSAIPSSFSSLSLLFLFSSLLFPLPEHLLVGSLVAAIAFSCCCFFQSSWWEKKPFSTKMNLLFTLLALSLSTCIIGLLARSLVVWILSLFNVVLSFLYSLFFLPFVKFLFLLLFQQQPSSSRSSLNGRDRIKENEAEFETAAAAESSTRGSGAAGRMRRRFFANDKETQLASADLSPLQADTASTEAHVHGQEHEGVFTSKSSERRLKKLDSQQKLQNFRVLFNPETESLALEGDLLPSLFLPLPTSTS